MYGLSGLWLWIKTDNTAYQALVLDKLFRTREIPRSGSKAKDGEKRKRERERERAKINDNNGQATHGARKHAWRTQAVWAKKERKKKEEE